MTSAQHASTTPLPAPTNLHSLCSDMEDGSSDIMTAINLVSRVSVTSTAEVWEVYSTLFYVLDEHAFLTEYFFNPHQ